MKKFALSLVLLLAFGTVGWWAVGLPHATDAIVAKAERVDHSADEAKAVSPATPAPSWRSGLQSAIVEANDEHKDVLLLFTGNGPSAVVLPIETQLASPAMVNRLGSRFVLARFDCHPDTAAADDAAATRDTWAERLAVKTFPYLLLLDGRGRACAGVDLNTVDPNAIDPAIAALQQHREQRDTCFAKADQQTGAAQAASLSAGLDAVRPYAQASYQPVMEKIVAEDPDDAAHLREIYFPLVTQSRIDVAVQHEIYPLIDRRLYQAAIDRITQLISEESPPPEQKQLLFAFQGQLFSNLGDDKSALKTLDEAIALAPGNPQVDKIRALRDHIAQGDKN